MNAGVGFPTFLGLLCAALAWPAVAQGETADLRAAIDRRSAAAEAQVLAWRRDIHAHPELSNREFRTSGLVTAELESRGLEVRAGIAR